MRHNGPAVLNRLKYSRHDSRGLSSPALGDLFAQIAAVEVNLADSGRSRRRGCDKSRHPQRRLIRCKSPNTFSVAYRSQAGGRSPNSLVKCLQHKGVAGSIIHGFNALKSPSQCDRSQIFNGYAD
jgi:hypothetical protein